MNSTASQSLLITELTYAHLQTYKSFLATGLANDTTSFRITVEDDAEARFPTGNRPDSFTLAAYADGLLAGVVSFTRDGADRQKLRHKGILFRMYVSAEHRGRGIAAALISTVVERVKALSDIEQINLTVITNNERAKAIYERAGFETFSSEKNAIKWDGQYFAEDQMVLRVRPQVGEAAQLL